MSATPDPSRAVTVPVPLADNESHTIDVGPVYCPSCKREFGNTEAEALREALRIAVEGLEGCTGLGAARDALAAVRELVDLGEKP